MRWIQGLNWLTFSVLDVRGLTLAVADDFEDARWLMDYFACARAIGPCRFFGIGPFSTN